MHSADGETHRLPRCKCPFYRECRHALKILSRLQTGLSDSRSLSSGALYRCLVSGAASNDLIWLVIRNALWVGKKLFSAQLAISPEGGRCGDLEESIDHAFFYCSVVRPLCKLLEGYMVRILNGKFFVQEAMWYRS